MNQSITDHLNDKFNTYVIVDGAKVEDLARKVAQIDKAKEVFPLYVNTCLSELLDVSPYLIQPQEMMAYEAFISSDEIKSACLIIQSSQSFEDVRDFWQSRLLVNLSPEHSAIFRLYDPEILHALLNYPESSPSYQLLGHSQSVHYWNTNKSQWVTYNLPPESKNDPTERLIVTEGDLLALSQLRVEHTLFQLAQHIVKYFPTVVEGASEAEKLAKYIYQQASSLGFGSEQALFLFSNVWCHLGQECLDVDIHPNIALLLTKSDTTSHMQRVEQAVKLASKQLPNTAHHAKTYLI